MNRETVIQFACLYGPIIGSTMLGLIARPNKRTATGLLFALCWVAALLPWADLAAQSAGYWSYGFSGPRIGEMPLSLYLGWIIGWGVFAPLLVSVLKGKLWIAVGIVAVLDLRLMPELTPVIQLGPNWWIGEIVFVTLLLLPALWLALTTEKRTHTPLRAAMLVPAFGGIVLGIPFILLCPFDEVIARYHPLWLIAAIAASIPGITAVRDLALSGDGTPVPLDPPRHLVTHGIYSYCRNPMQFSMTTLLLLQSAYLSNIWPAIIALLSAIYSEGFARWSEQHDMHQRFGKRWQQYRESVRPWIPRWKPAVEETCELWIDMGCSPCSLIGSWFEQQNTTGLILRDAREWPGKPLQRITWHHQSSGRTESGIRAAAMGFQHINLSWAILGWIISMPLISHLLQASFDAAGAGPRPTTKA